MAPQDVRTYVAGMTGKRLARAEETQRFVLLVPGEHERFAAVQTDSQVVPHYVTAHGCDCKGWAHTGHCYHWDAVMLAVAREIERKEAASSAAPSAHGDTATTAPVDPVDELFPEGPVPSVQTVIGPRRDGEPMRTRQWFPTYHDAA